jgi:hypothetical protein
LPLVHRFGAVFGEEGKELKSAVFGEEGKEST